MFPNSIKSFADFASNQLSLIESEIRELEEK